MPKRIIKKIKFTIIPITLLSLFYYSFAFAIEQTDLEKETDSMYRYNALENKNSFSVDTSITGGKLIRKLPENHKLILVYDNTKDFQYIIEKQNISLEKLENIMDALRNRSGLKTFLIGNNLGKLRFQLVQIKDEASVLEALALKAEYFPHMLEINNQFNFLKEKQIKVEAFILEQENEFSLFGWLVTSL